MIDHTVGRMGQRRSATRVPRQGAIRHEAGLPMRPGFFSPIAAGDPILDGNGRYQLLVARKAINSNTHTAAKRPSHFSADLGANPMADGKRERTLVAANGCTEEYRLGSDL